MIISEGEVGIDVPVGDHGEVEMVSFRRLVRINGADELNELGDTETHQWEGGASSAASDGDG